MREILVVIRDIDKEKSHFSEYVFSKPKGKVWWEIIGDALEKYHKKEKPTSYNRKSSIEPVFTCPYCQKSSEYQGNFRKYGKEHVCSVRIGAHVRVGQFNCSRYIPMEIQKWQCGYCFKICYQNLRKDYFEASKIEKLQEQYFLSKIGGIQ